MNKTIAFLLPLLILIVASVIGYITINNKPEASRKKPPPAVSAVDVLTLETRSFPVSITTQGSVTAHTETTLISQVAGEITTISPRFRAGSFFQKGELLLQIDPRDYEVAVTLAESSLAQARLSLSQEQARSKQARRDWQRLGEAGEPGELVLRKPQLKTEQASIAAAEGQLVQARLNLERTRIKAPYEGYLLEKSVDLGQFVNPGNSLGKVFAVDYAEVRLPLKSSQLSLVSLPEAFRSATKNSAAAETTVTLKAKIGTKTWDWPATIVRSEGAIDTRSRQTYVIAKVEDPYRQRSKDQPPLKVGQFVQAEILGKTLENVFVIPEPALRAGNTVFIVKDDDTLERREVNVVWRESGNIIVDQNLSVGEKLVTTAVGLNLGGTRVTINKPTASADGQ